MMRSNTAIGNSMKFTAVVQGYSMIIFGEICDRENQTALNASFHGTICRPDLSAGRRRSANLACILTADECSIHGIENRSE